MYSHVSVIFLQGRSFPLAGKTLAAKWTFSSRLGLSLLSWLRRSISAPSL